MYPRVDPTEMSTYPATPAYPAPSVYPAAPAYSASPVYPPYPPGPPDVYAAPAMPMPSAPMPNPMAMPGGHSFEVYTAADPMPGCVTSAPAWNAPPEPAVAAFGPDSVSMVCPHCNVMISTDTTKTHKTCTHLCCCCMFFSVICTLCSCMPYCCCDAESVEHTCPNCSARLGIYYS